MDEYGVVLGIGSGEAHVTAWHADSVAVARIIQPFKPLAQPNLKKTWQNFPSRGTIDSLVSAKWSTLGLEPSSYVDDEGFLRRVWVDLLGLLPTIDERAEFLADCNPNKRENWIDKALSSTAFIDYWTHRFEDLFLVRNGRLQQPAVWAFHHDLRIGASTSVGSR